MRGHLQCRDTLAGNEGCPLKTGTTVLSCANVQYVIFKYYFDSCTMLLGKENKQSDRQPQMTRQTRDKKRKFT